MIFLYILILALGFVGLIKGADWFVDGAADLAKTFKVPGVIIGLTVVAMGTSAPELAVSVSAAVRGSNEIALSNVIGSNLFNLLCVLGVCAVIRTLPVDTRILKRDFPIYILISLLAAACIGGPSVLNGSFLSAAFSDEIGQVSRPVGLILFACFICYIVGLIIAAIKNPTQEEETGEIRSIPKCLLLLLIGVALIVGGGQAVVRSAEAIATIVGMSKTLIGLTVVSVGTSLPELVTSIVAAHKGETGMAVGNVAGSNIFNLMLILGISAAIHPFAANRACIWDMFILSVISILTWIFCGVGKSIKRVEGILMVAAYIGIMVFAAVR
ncbi:MAG: calcium/sodium antiporter [Lachnospiraceae bacterium]|nr:calcium/sodium antiporter [Lachnospiraceae bacterium]